ncbi:MAG: glycosyltransferase family 2 protein [Bacteroidales bacterium]|nr:glycosyltransferase family 2 protein [Bacteroidales bacterium]
MILALQILFWVVVALVFHTYVGFPVLLSLLSRNKKNEYHPLSGLPDVTVIMSLFNEEDVIAQKLQTIADSDYPLEKLHVLIGSDNSTDRTNEIVSEYAQKYPFIKLFAYTERRGKANVINSLIAECPSDIMILSDANVMFDKNTISELMKPFADEKVGLVDSNMINTGLKKDGISIQEKSYISREVRIKNQEGLLWGSMMGPFGGCFAMRKDLHSPVPKNFLVDDFYICMNVIRKGYKTVNNVDARVYEDVSNNISDEFRRKVRIATGDFQNLHEFRDMLFTSRRGVSFCFWSHKVLRWITPVLMIIWFGLCVALVFYLKFYLVALLLFAAVLLLIPIDYILKKLNCNNVLLRFVTHFFSMNLALLVGMFKAMKGVESGVWKPTKRNQ